MREGAKCVGGGVRRVVLTLEIVVVDIVATMSMMCVCVCVCPKCGSVRCRWFFDSSTTWRRRRRRRLNNSHRLAARRSGAFVFEVEAGWKSIFRRLFSRYGAPDFKSNSCFVIDITNRCFDKQASYLISQLNVESEQCFAAAAEGLCCWIFPVEYALWFFYGPRMMT